MSEDRRLALCIGIALAAILVAGRDAAAHAVLTHTQPAANASISEPPARVQLIFNERVEPIFNSIRIVDANGVRHDVGAPRVLEDGSVVEVAVERMAPGAYTVLWSVNSVDGHNVRGYFGFGVAAPPPGESTMLAASAVRTSGVWTFYRWFVKGTDLAAVTLWLGALAFGLLVFDVPSWLPATAGVAFIVLECLGFLNQSAVLGDTSLAGALSPAMLLTVASSTNFGQWWLVRVASASALLALTSWRERRKLGGLIALGGLVLITYPMTGHAHAVSSYAAIAVAVDWLHLAATAVWLGGLATFVVVASTRAGAGPDADAIGPRFSQVAFWSVMVLIATGAYNAWLHMPDWTSFVTTTYGRVLLAKLALVAAILSVASVSRRRSAGGIRRLRALITIEVALAVPVIALVATLTSLPPATTQASSGPLTSTKAHGAAQITLTIQPNKVGANLASVVVEGQSVQHVSLFVKSLDMDMGVQTFDAVRSSDGSFIADIVIPMVGRSLVTVQISPAKSDAYAVDFETYSSM